jgi:hypothetical protein
MISQCHNHPNCSHCFVCGEAINWVEDYGHEFPDGLAACVACYETKDATLVWRKKYESKQRMWRNFDSFNRLMETHPHMRDEFINHLKELEDSND